MGQKGEFINTEVVTDFGEKKKGAKLGNDGTRSATSGRERGNVREDFHNITRKKGNAKNGVGNKASDIQEESRVMNLREGMRIARGHRKKKRNKQNPSVMASLLLSR